MTYRTFGIDEEITLASARRSPTTFRRLVDEKLLYLRRAGANRNPSQPRPAHEHYAVASVPGATEESFPITEADYRELLASGVPERS